MNLERQPPTALIFRLEQPPSTRPLPLASLKRRGRRESLRLALQEYMAQPEYSHAFQVQKRNPRLPKQRLSSFFLKFQRI